MLGLVLDICLVCTCVNDPMTFFANSVMLEGGHRSDMFFNVYEKRRRRVTYHFKHLSKMPANRARRRVLTSYLQKGNIRNERIHLHSRPTRSARSTSKSPHSSPVMKDGSQSEARHKRERNHRRRRKRQRRSQNRPSSVQLFKSIKTLVADGVSSGVDQLKTMSFALIFVVLVLVALASFMINAHVRIHKLEQLFRQIQ